MPSPNKRVFWVVSRKAVRQSVFTFAADIPENKRNAVLRVQVRRWAPFPQVKYVAQWSANKASVYAWNDEEVKRTIAEAGLSERRCIVYPETFIRAPQQNGVRLIAAIEGFEGQVWQQGFLAFSRWWPKTPSQLEWDMFLRSAGLPLDQYGGRVPDISPSEFLEGPWLKKDGHLGAAWSALDEPRYAAAAALLIAGPFIYFTAEYATLAVAKVGVENQVETLSVETQGLRKLRAEAIANLDEIEDYLSLEVYPNHYETMVVGVSLLQNLNIKIAEWTYDVGTLSMTLRSQNELDPTHLITTFEKSGAFTNVSASRLAQDGFVRVRMDVLPKQVTSVKR
jgi:hypothetical protein